MLEALFLILKFGFLLNCEGKGYGNKKISLLLENVILEYVKLGIYCITIFGYTMCCVTIFGVMQCLQTVFQLFGKFFVESCDMIFTVKWNMG